MYLYFINFSMASNYSLLKEIMDAKMYNGECAIDHMKSMTDRLNMIGYVDTEIDETTRVEIILKSLAEEYAGFKEYFRGLDLRYVMEKFQRWTYSLAW